MLTGIVMITYLPSHSFAILRNHLRALADPHHIALDLCFACYTRYFSGHHTGLAMCNLELEERTLGESHLHLRHLSSFSGC